MRNYILIGLFLLGVVMQLPAQEKAAPAAPKAKQPLAYEAFFKKDMRKIGEILPVYTDGKNYFLEIGKDVLGTDLLVSGIIVKGPWTGESTTLTDRIRFSLGAKDQLEVLQEFLDSRIDSTKSDAGLVEAFEASNMPSTKFSYPIHAFGAGKNGYIIDITKDVTSAGQLFAYPGLPWVNRPVANRLLVDTVCLLDRGVKFLTTHAQTDYMQGGFGMPGMDKHNTVRIEWTIQRLPESRMAAREADPRVGYAEISYNDFSKDPTSVKKETIIRRWKLVVKPEDREKYERGELVEPADPILVYIDRTFVGGYRRVAAEAIQEWNAAFAAAGFKNVLRLQEGEAPSVWGYRTINCMMQPALGKTNTVSDPRTGEILGGSIIVSLITMDASEGSAKSLLGAVEPLVFSDSLSAVRHQLCRRQISEQFGMVLGLLPNAAGRFAYTPAQLRDKAWVKENGISSTIMDGCLVNFVAQPEDGIAFADLFGHVSHYDRWALEYGYRVYPAGKEKESSKALLMKAKDNSLLAYTLKARGQINPIDMTSDVFEAINLGMKNLATSWKQVEQLSATLDKEDTWDNYWGMAQALTSQHNVYMSAAFNHIGKVQIEPVIKGFNDCSWTDMPRSEQARAVKFLEDHVFSGVPAWMQYSPMRGLTGYNGEETMTTILNLTCGLLTSPGVVEKLLLTERQQPGKAYTATELFRTLDRAVFNDFSTSRPVDRYSRREQFLFAKNLVEAYKAADVQKNMDTPVSGFMIMQMKKTLKAVDRLGRTHADTDSRNHYRGLYVYMQHLVNKEKDPGKEEAKKEEVKSFALDGLGNIE